LTVSHKRREVRDAVDDFIDFDDDERSVIESSRGVVELERLATAMWVTSERGDAPPSERAALLRKIKPHINPPDALKALEEIDSLVAASTS